MLDFRRSDLKRSGVRHGRRYGSRAAWFSCYRSRVYRNPRRFLCLVIGTAPTRLEPLGGPGARWTAPEKTTHEQVRKVGGRTALAKRKRAWSAINRLPTSPGFGAASWEWRHTHDLPHQSCFAGSQGSRDCSRYSDSDRCAMACPDRDSDAVEMWWIDPEKTTHEQVRKVDGRTALAKRFAIQSDCLAHTPPTSWV
jgi:hypothetical protein